MGKTGTLLISVLLISNLLCSQPNEVKTYFDLAYLEEEQVEDNRLQRLNLLIPKGKDKCPLLIWIGGGAWSYGDRDQEMDLAKEFAQKGIAVASIGHRLSPAIWRDTALNTGIQHPDHAEDVAAAVHWLYENADSYGYDRNGFFIGGYSSGAHLATLISLDSTYLGRSGLSLELFKGIIPISGTYDIVDYHTVLSNSGRPELAELHVEAVFGSTEEAFRQASPITYLEYLSKPVLLISDNNMYNYSKLLEEKIRATTFRDMQVVYAYDLSHGALWRNMSFDEDSLYRDIVIRFIKKHWSLEDQ